VKVRLEGAAASHPAARPGAPPALQATTLDIAPGEQVAVIGPSGAGKTTLLHLVACALRPLQGRVLLDDVDPWQLTRARLQRLRGELFLAAQVPPLPPRQRVVTAVLAGRLPRMGLLQSLRSLFYPTGIAQADAALERFDLSDKLFARVDRLSGGERQRVGLARAVVAQPKLLLVDEPLSALDPARAQQAMQSLTQAAREVGATLLCTLHDVPMALATFPRIIALRDGAVMFDLPAAQVTPELLRTLYESKLEELQGNASLDAPPPRELPRPAMHCR
jgi:phosphonate transport system ATP-binding protein